MGIFVAGVVMLVVGALLNPIGWALHRRSQMDGLPPELWEWFIAELTRWFPLLTGRSSTGGERLAAFGAILAIVGIIVALLGAIAWAAA